MKRAGYLFCGWLCACGSVAAQEPQVRASLTTPNDIFVGQRVLLVVELLAPGIFASTAAFDLPDPSGVLLVPPSEAPELSNEEINGASYTIQRHEVSIFARRAGEVKIPALTVRFNFKRNPLDPDAVAASVKTEPAHFLAKLPPGAEKLGSVISARSLTAVESWNPEPGKAKAGDAFTRTIVFSAPDIPAMAFPPFAPRPIDGFGIYPKPPEVLDRSDRGKLLGERRDTITYVCQRAGEFVIPAARFTWFDLDGQQLQTIDFPARKIMVATNPAMAAITARQTEAGTNWELFAFIFSGALGLLLLAFLHARIRRSLRRVLDTFRPVHLAPLNPSPVDAKR